MEAQPRPSEPSAGCIIYACLLPNPNPTFCTLACVPAAIVLECPNFFVLDSSPCSLHSKGPGIQPVPAQSPLCTDFELPNVPLFISVQLVLKTSYMLRSSWQSSQFLHSCPVRARVLTLQFVAASGCAALIVILYSFLQLPLNVQILSARHGKLNRSGHF